MPTNLITQNDKRTLKSYKQKEEKDETESKRQKEGTLKWRGRPVLGPMPFSPVQRALKLSQVLGTMSL